MPAQIHYKNPETGEVFDKKPTNADVIPNFRRKNKNNGLGIDLQDLAMSGGSGLLAYTLADQVFGGEAVERKKRSAFDRLLSKLIPIGIGGLGAVAGKKISDIMRGGPGIEKNSQEKSQAATNDSRQVVFPVVSIPEYKNTDDIARVPVHTDPEGKLLVDKDGNPKIVPDDIGLSLFGGRTRLPFTGSVTEYYDDAAREAAERNIGLGEALKDKIRKDETKMWAGLGGGAATGLASIYPWLKGSEFEALMNSKLSPYGGPGGIKGTIDNLSKEVETNAKALKNENASTTGTKNRVSAAKARTEVVQNELNAARDRLRDAQKAQSEAIPLQAAAKRYT